MYDFDDDFDYFIEQELGKENKMVNTYTYTPTVVTNNTKFPIVPKTDTIKQLNHLPSTPISLDKYHEIFTLFKLYITKSKPGLNKRLFIQPSYVSKHVFEETKQQIEQLNDFINNMNKTYRHKNVDFDEILYNQDVSFVQSLYQRLVSNIIENFRPFYKKHKTAIDYVNDPKNITRGAGKKTRKQRQRHTQKQKNHKRSTNLKSLYKKRRQLKRKNSKHNSTKKSNSNSNSNHKSNKKYTKSKQKRTKMNV